MPLLVLLRHAQAEPTAADAAAGDAGRALTARGRADAAEAGRWLAARGIVPDRAVVSPAVRTRQTFALLAVPAVEAAVDERLWSGGAEGLLEVVAETPAPVGTLLVVGHNPAVERAAWQLDDSPAARDRTDRGLPAGAAALIELDAWDDGAGRLLELRAP